LKFLQLELGLRKCTICYHPKKAEIEGEILNGVSYRNIAERFGISIATVSRHAKHMQVLVEKPIPSARLDITRELQECILKAKEVLNESQDPRLTLSSLSVLGRLIETAAKLTLILVEKESQEPPHVVFELIDASQSKDL